MPFLFHVDESMKVFHVAIGEVNDTELMDLSARLRQEAFVSGYPILCDCSALTTVSISASLIESLAMAARSRTNFVAVVLPFQSRLAWHVCTKYSTIQRMRAFTCLCRPADAMAWLETEVEELTLRA